MTGQIKSERNFDLLPEWKSIVRINHIILNPPSFAVSGDVCTGSTELAKALAGRFGYTYFGVGQLVRILSKKLGYRGQHERFVHDFRQIIQDDPTIRLGLVGYVVEGRQVAIQAGRVKIPVLKILTTASPEIILERYARREQIPKPEARSSLEKRLTEDDLLLEHCWQLTRDDIFNPERYDIIVDTSRSAPDEIVEEIIQVTSPVSTYSLNRQQPGPPASS